MQTIVCRLNQTCQQSNEINYQNSLLSAWTAWCPRQTRRSEFLRLSAEEVTVVMLFSQKTALNMKQFWAEQRGWTIHVKVMQLNEFKPSRALRSTDSGQVVEPRVLVKHGEATFRCYNAHKPLQLELKSALNLICYMSCWTIIFNSTPLVYVTFQSPFVFSFPYSNWVSLTFFYYQFSLNVSPLRFCFCFNLKNELPLWMKCLRKWAYINIWIQVSTVLKF